MHQLRYPGVEALRVAEGEVEATVRDRSVVPAGIYVR
jgi:hypothetical protein